MGYQKRSVRTKYHYRIRWHGEVLVGAWKALRAPRTRERVKALGYELTEEEINRTFQRFKDLADRKKTIFDEDIEAIIAEEVCGLRRLTSCFL